MAITAVAADEPGRPRPFSGDPRAFLAGLAEVAADQRAHPWTPPEGSELAKVPAEELNWWMSLVDPSGFLGPAFRAGRN